MTNLKYHYRLLIFAYKNDITYKRNLKIISGVLLSPIPFVWFFDFYRLEPLFQFHIETQTLLRLSAIGILLELFLISLIFNNLYFYNKYKKFDNLPQGLKDKFIIYSVSKLNIE